jgi:riboflavin kinase/FMN adenylyltransferase
MRLDEELAQTSTDRDSVLTVGVFDGVHRGHRDLISRLVSEASDTARSAGVVTFRNHPASVLKADFEPRYLTGLDERLRLIGALGTDLIAPVTFDSDLTSLKPREFIERLQRHLRMRGLVVGPDFALGHRREGDLVKLRALGEEMGFSLTTVDVMLDDGRPIRSTAIRAALADGDVDTAATFLGRTFALDGVVVKGAGRGRVLGFPTANLEVPPRMVVPGDGIYATWALLGDRRLMAATSIGTRPTFDEKERTVEAFILDYQGELYDQKVRLEFVRRLRDEIKYDTAEALQEQIQKDVDQTRSILRAIRPVS